MADYYRRDWPVGFRTNTQHLARVIGRVNVGRNRFDERDFPSDCRWVMGISANEHGTWVELLEFRLLGEINKCMATR